MPSCYNVSLILSHEVLIELKRLIENFKNINAEDVSGQILNSHNSGGTRHGPLQNDGTRGRACPIPRTRHAELVSASSHWTCQEHRWTDPEINSG